ncbi:hypothetical protein [Halegenticoccus tardaugens]|uniref:hypothetical protein n=1 Tax=Halegenticoccus tardaugens TaxID=2071624 RepID=UPI00100AA470|nr:hypothetical protein [Halegenticoccus tardaugens]
MTETTRKNVPGQVLFDAPWTRVEGVLAVGALLTSFIWFLGMPTGMAIGVGFGLVLLLDFFRALIFDSARSSGSRFTPLEFSNQ